ncbi:MAG: inositol monophosphatase family protein [Candidatus Ornithospirochaeta sp.]
MRKEELQARLDEALRIVRTAGDFLLSHSEMGRNVEAKAANDFVTAADKMSEKIILDAIREKFPEDGWLGEESGICGDSRRRWIVDPIDGTVDYMCSFPNYTVSIAFEDEDGLALGVVAIPRQNEIFWALRGGGAYLNGEKIHTNEASDYSRTLAILVPPHRRHEIMGEYMAKMEKFYSVFTDARSLGSCACSLCYVACGRCTAYYEMSLYPYDFAGGTVILREAGGKVTITGRDGGKCFDILATSSGVHNTTLELIK